MASLRGRSTCFLPLFHRRRLRSRRERAGRLRPIHQRDGEHITLAFVARERVSRSNLHSSLLQPTQRTPDESRNHFRLRRNAFFDYRVSQLKEEAVFVDGASSSMNLGDVKGKESEKEVVERWDNFTSLSSVDWNETDSPDVSFGFDQWLSWEDWSSH